MNLILDMYIFYWRKFRIKKLLYFIRIKQFYFFPLAGFATINKMLCGINMVTHIGQKSFLIPR